MVLMRSSRPRPDGSLAWLGPIDPRMIVLDVACGAGHTAQAVAPHVRQVVGLDLTDALLRLGGQRIAAAGVSNVLLQSGNANALPFVDDSFDLVTCRTSLHHFVAPEVALAEMARVCRSGGRVVVSDMVAPDGTVRDSFDALHLLIDPSHVRVLLDDEIDQLVTTAVGPVTRHDRAGRGDAAVRGDADRRGGSCRSARHRGRGAHRRCRDRARPCRA